MVEAAERSGAHSGLVVIKSVRGSAVIETAGSRTVIKTAGSMAEIVVIYKCPAPGDVGVVVEDDCPAAPAHSPMTPSPPETPEETQPESHAKSDAWSREKEPRVRIPARPHSNGRAIHKPRIVLWYVDHIRGCRFDGDVFPLFRYFLLRSAL